MNNLIHLHTARKARLQARAKGITLCRSGFHQWQTAIDSPFKVQSGKLLITEHCRRCQQQRTRLT